MARKAKAVYEVFVSHATADKFLAEVGCEKIEATGAKTFRDDRDIPAGANIYERIIAAMKRAREFLVILSPQSRHRDWVLMESGMAANQGCFMVPFRHQLAADEIPDALTQYNARELTLRNLGLYVAELQARVDERRPS